MKATLEFDLEDYDDRMRHLACVKAGDMALALWDMLYNNYTLQEVLEKYSLNPDEYTR